MDFELYVIAKESTKARDSRIVPPKTEKGNIQFPIARIEPQAARPSGLSHEPFLSGGNRGRNRAVGIEMIINTIVGKDIHRVYLVTGQIVRAIRRRSRRCR